MIRTLIFFAFGLVLLAPAKLNAQVTLKQIMQDPDWIGNAPQSPYWSDDGSSLYYFQKREGSEIRDLYNLSLDGTKSIVNADRLADAGAATGDWSTDRSQKVFAREGDLYLRDLKSSTLRQLTRTAAQESAPFFLHGDSRIAFQRGGTVFIRDLVAGLESQPFDIREDDDPAEKEDEEYIEAQQDRLFEIIRKRERREDETRDHKNELRSNDDSRVPPTWFVGKKFSISRSKLSPTGEQVVLLFAPKKLTPGKADNMPEWVTDTGYVNNREVRALVGTTPAPDNSLVLLDAITRKKLEIKLDALPMIADDPLADLKKAAKARNKAAKKSKQVADESEASDATQKIDGDQAESGDEEIDSEKDQDDEPSEDSDEGSKEKASQPRPVAISNIVWSDGGAHFAFQATSHDHKDRWTCVYDIESNELVTVEHLRNVDGWINWAFNDLGWLPNIDSLWFLSEASGYSHLYRWDAGTQKAEQLTQGSFEVAGITLFAEPSRVLATSNREHPGIREIYSIDTRSGEMTQVSNLRGIAGGGIRGGGSVAISPDESSIAFLYSSITNPNEIYVQGLDGDVPAQQLTESRSVEFSSIDWVVPEIVTIPSAHVNEPIYARLYMPESNAPGLGADGKRPVVCFVHGAGYKQNVHFGWSSYFREFMFHTLLTEQGYIVIDMDYRASAGYGAAWRTAIYRQMGTPELEDYLDGIQWLVANKNADPDRVGVYGGSYGGFITFMALFKAPESFAAGAALRPVTDWAHYNNGYTSSILNTPEVDPEAYERSSPIEFAEGLQDPLLICHGMIDDNVFFKDSVRLVQRFIELEKENWELAVYPIEAHAFREPSSWLDEYRRIFKLFEENLK